MTAFHDPVPDRLFGPLARPLLGRVPPLALTLISLALAATAFAAFAAEQRIVAGLLILAAALADAGAAAPTPSSTAPTPNPSPNAGGGETQHNPHTGLLGDSSNSSTNTRGEENVRSSPLRADMPLRPQPLPPAGGRETVADTGNRERREGDDGNTTHPELTVRPSPSIGGGLGNEASGRGPARALALAVDTVTDRYGDVLVCAGLAVWAHGQESGPAPLALGFAAAAGALGFGYGMVRTWASAGHRPAGRLFGMPGRDLRLLVAAAGALTGLVYPALALLAVIGNLPVFLALARLPDFLREDAPAR